MLMTPKLKPIGPFLKGEIYDYIGLPSTTLRRYSLSTRRWHVVQTEPQQEARVEAALEDARFGSYVPRVPKKIRIVRERYRTVMRPMLVGYVLAGFGPEEEWEPIMDMRGVLRVFMINSRPVPIGATEMQRIWEAEERERQGKKRVSRFLPDIMDFVQIKEGPFAHFFGSVIEVDGEKFRVKVEIDIFGRPTPVELAGDQFEVVLDRPAGIGATVRPQYRRTRRGLAI
jgi:transcriptional antiterminator NusG